MSENDYMSANEDIWLRYTGLVCCFRCKRLDKELHLKKGVLGCDVFIGTPLHMVLWLTPDRMKLNCDAKEEPFCSLYRSDGEKT